MGFIRIPPYLLLASSFIFLCAFKNVLLAVDTCDAESFGCSARSIYNEIKPKTSHSKAIIRKYLLYDVNPGEGFNLRRDVYMRIAALAHKVRAEKPSDDWVLVLPPWGPLYHWNNKESGYQEKLPWSLFFDLESFSKYVPVIEFHEFLKQYSPVIDIVYYLQHYPDMGASGHWEEAMEEGKCLEPPPYKMLNGKIYGWFWGYEDIYCKNLRCMFVQGSSSTLKPLLFTAKFRSVMVDRAEVILHDSFGDADYWMVRRSMRFSKNLQNIGNEFRAKYLNSSDKVDKTEKHENWLLQSSKTRSAVGGPYIAVHLRRRDYVKAKPLYVPSIENAAKQIMKKMALLHLSAVFVATDAPVSEFKQLKKFIPTAIQYNPSKNVRETLKDGGVAIVDQWICAHARYFIGTHESTFSFRIQEEREILGFPPDMTFNRLCGDNETFCKQPTKWKIVYP